MLLPDRSADRAAELVLPVEAALRRKEIARVESGVTQKLEAAAMQLVGAGLGDHIDDAAAVVAVLGVEVVGQDAELGDRIEIGHDGSAAVHQLLHVAAVDHEAVGVFALAADRLVAGVQTAGGSNRHRSAGHDDRVGLLRGHRHDARLKRQKIGEAAAVERDRGHDLAANDFAHLGALDIDVHRGIQNRDLLRLFADLQEYVYFQSRVYIDDYASALVGLEAWATDFDLIVPHGDDRECVEAVVIRVGRPSDPRIGVANHYSCIWNDRTSGVFHRAGNAPACACPRVSACKKKNRDEDSRSPRCVVYRDVYRGSFSATIEFIWPCAWQGPRKTARNAIPSARS